jgi:hypothetical protein
MPHTELTRLAELAGVTLPAAATTPAPEPRAAEPDIDTDAVVDALNGRRPAEDPEVTDAVTRLGTTGLITLIVDIVSDRREPDRDHVCRTALTRGWITADVATLNRMHRLPGGPFAVRQMLTEAAAQPNPPEPAMVILWAAAHGEFHLALDTVIAATTDITDAAGALIADPVLREIVRNRAAHGLPRWRTWNDVNPALAEHILTHRPGQIDVLLNIIRDRTGAPWQRLAELTPPPGLETVADAYADDARPRDPAVVATIVTRAAGSAWLGRHRIVSMHLDINPVTAGELNQYLTEPGLRLNGWLTGQANANPPTRELVTGLDVVQGHPREVLNTLIHYLRGVPGLGRTPALVWILDTVTDPAGVNGLPWLLTRLVQAGPDQTGDTDRELARRLLPIAVDVFGDNPHLWQAFNTGHDAFTYHSNSFITAAKQVTT